MLLNVWGVAFSLATAASAVLGHPFVIGTSTAFFGAIWALTLRSTRIGWIASLPLAAMNAMASFALLRIARVIEYGPFNFDQFVKAIFEGAALGGTLGAIIWFPAWLLTLMVFGWPLRHAQQLARKGLAGEENGERLVGVASASVAAFAILAILLVGTGLVPVLSGRGDRGGAQLWLFGAIAIALGSAAAYIAHTRVRERRAFVASVERGEVEGFRIDDSADGRALVRTAENATYRVADFREELARLDESGEVTELSGEIGQASRATTERSL